MADTSTPSGAELTLAEIRSEIRQVERALAAKDPNDKWTGYGSTGVAPGAYLEDLRRYEAEYEERVAALKANEEA